MPVASYKQGPHKIGPKEIPAPKQADLRSWWNEVRKVFPDIGLWAEVLPDYSVDEQVIHFTWVSKGGYTHDIFIARKQRLR